MGKQPKIEEIRARWTAAAALDACLRDHLRIRAQQDVAWLLAEVERLSARLAKAEDVVLMARQLTAYAWEDRLEDCAVSDAARHDSRELGTAVWLYDQLLEKDGAG